MKEQEIEFGDIVTHKDPLVNGGLQMTVEKVENGLIMCSHFFGPEAIHKVSSFPLIDVKLIRKANGGFFA